MEMRKRARRPTAACKCGRVCATVGGLKAHQRSCSELHRIMRAETRALAAGLVRVLAALPCAWCGAVVEPYYAHCGAQRFVDENKR